MPNFKFGSGELYPRIDDRPSLCTSCGDEEATLIKVTGTEGCYRWMCRACMLRYKAYMAAYFLKLWSHRDAVQAGGMYRVKIYETNAVIIADGMEVRYA